MQSSMFHTLIVSRKEDRIKEIDNEGERERGEVMGERAVKKKKDIQIDRGRENERDRQTEKQRES